MLGEDRVIVYDQPGTTRDSIYIPFERNDEKYTLIDTAGVRKRGKIHEEVEKVLRGQKPCKRSKTPTW